MSSDGKRATMHPRIHALSQPDALALIMADTGETISYAQLEARANRAAHGLRALGVGIGDTVAVVCDNRPEFFDLFWGTQRAGVTMVPVSTRLKSDEIAYIANDSGAKVLLISDYLGETAQELAKMRDSIPGLEHILAIGSIDGLLAWGTLCAAQPEGPIADEANGARMSYSSGTTGRPKGIKNAVPFAGSDPIQPQGAVKLFGGLYPFDEKTIYLSPAPLYHAAPMGFTTTTQSLGGTAVVMEKFDPEAYLELIERYRVTLTQLALKLQVFLPLSGAALALLRLRCSLKTFLL